MRVEQIYIRNNKDEQIKRRDGKKVSKFESSSAWMKNAKKRRIKKKKKSRKKTEANNIEIESIMKIKNKILL